MKNLSEIRTFIRKTLLSEGLSNKIYHFTNFYKLLSIINDDKFKLSSVLGSPSDQKINNGKFFYLSTTRSRHSDVGFGSGNVCINLDGRKLMAAGFTGAPVDYWQTSTNPKDFDDPIRYISALSSKELEDRIITNKPSIDKASRFIDEIHIYMRINFMTSTARGFVKLVVDYCNKNNIPLYFYDDMKYWDNQVKSKSIDQSLVISKTPDKKEEMYRPAKEGSYRVFALLMYKDDDNKNKISQIVDSKDFEEINEVLKKDYFGYFKYADEHDANMYAAQIQNAIGNNRANANEYWRAALKMLTEDIKKNNLGGLLDYIKLKLFKQKKEGK